ncbi:glycosyltransferase family 4 protein [Baekduia soli]|uniref:glycosyltransferase family 4 protein n=1 Tax=Baekduia soli TaxID=496014 RepID=UPI001E47E638|nr:glycosyltransferase family 4 protein [Baekduia soli]
MPAGHVYVRHLAHPDGEDGVRRLRDIPPPDGRRVPGGWWPPAMLDAAWIAEHHASFDVFHVHFGFDAKTPDELRAVVQALEHAHVPLVVTVHDLRNPHHSDTRLHEEQLSVLVEHAHEVVTLTPGARCVIMERWGRTARVLPHPHVVDWTTMQRPRPRRADFVVGIHAKSLRANMDVPSVAVVVADAVRQLPGAVLRIDVHDEVYEPGNHFYAPEVGGALERLARDNDAVTLCRHAYFTDDELWDYLIRLDVSVLPYRFGTHSGWLEACFDLGTAVVAPTCGFYGEQQPCSTYQHDEHELDAASLVAAVRHAYEHRPAPRADVDQRRRQRRQLADAHRTLYEEVLG